MKHVTTENNNYELDFSTLPSPADTGDARVAIVHDWLTGMRGGEKVLEGLVDLLPRAQVFTLLHIPGSVSSKLEASRPKQSFIRFLPGVERHYRRYLPLFPIAVEQFDLDEFDLVISTSHCAVKSTVVPNRAFHLCYCHTPMRYAWDQFESYFGSQRVGRLANLGYRIAMNKLARWDASTANRVDQYIANSHYVATRISRYYDRMATVIYPPVNTTFYSPSDSRPDSYFLIVSALVPYKKIDVAIEACRLANVPLRIVGDGPELPRLQTLSEHNVEFMGTCSDIEIRDLYRGSLALLLPGEEDFGISPVESLACGRPVVALNKGGVTETVIDGETGILVNEPTAEALADGLNRATDINFDSTYIRQSSLRFSLERFYDEMRASITNSLS